MAGDEAQAMIARLDLSPHPEGGWYRETWREDPADDGRGLATAVLFLLEQGQRSHWHRVDAAELWLFQAGHALDLLSAPNGSGPIETIRLGADILVGDMPQHLIPKGAWQAAEASRGWALVSCIVAPGFAFSGFELAPPGWAPGA